MKLKFVFKSKVVACVAAIFLFKNCFLLATHNTSRYFPFLERPEEYVLKGKSHISPSLFITRASTAFKRGGGNTGIPELWGKYDLRDVIDSLAEVKTGFTNPIEEERGPGDRWIDKSIKFKVDGKIKSRGLLLNYEQDLDWRGFSVGANIPVMHVNTNDKFTFLEQDSADELKNLRAGELAQLDRIRRNAHNQIGLQGGDWTKTGLGDLDLHLRFNKNWDHELMMRDIDLNFQVGLVIPTSAKSDINYPSSVSFMGNGHWGTYFDIVPEFELKQDWKLGFIFGAAYQFENARKLRLPVYREPAIFSGLIRNVKIDRGMTFKLSPYFTFQNLTDGVDFHFRYTYLRHNEDAWKDSDPNATVKSFLQRSVGDMFGGAAITQEDIDKNISEKNNQTRWRAHYITLQFTYDSKEANNNWVLDPIIYVDFDYQMNGNGSCKTHQFSLGVQLHF